MAKENGEHMSQNTTTTTKRSPEQHKNRQSANPNPTSHETNSWKEQGKGEEKQNKQRREEEKHCGKTHNPTKR
jgi:hypothetical protein